MSDLSNNIQRILPPNGIIIYPNIRYIDAHDMEPEVRKEASKYFHSDPEYKTMVEAEEELRLMDSPITRQFVVYVFKGDCPLGVIKYKNHSNHPEGYGPNDFRLVKAIYPPYRRTKYSRYASADLTHMLFYSTLAQNIYVYQKIKKEKANEFMSFFAGNEPDAPPCSIPPFENDGPNVQKYISIKTIYDISDKAYSIVLYHFDGDKYRAMNLRKYLTTPEIRKPELVDLWIQEMNRAAELVRQTWMP